ncbi:LADA_0H11166g1_1 [Lachancea dasiensis]|uniref:Pre-mRNA polyadenylation factor FIP1 n=1 Tax=Lachancea dasiensis TaxID=1072105 RepID=A0A1G4K3C3_9SACH|nr:LADA_0H11166g1_1 [Lachancea dasiensis]
MSSSDEDEKFLYGSDDENTVMTGENTKKRAPADGDTNAATTGESAKRAKTMGEFDSTASSGAVISNSSSSEEASSDDENSDEESDVEFIIGVGTDSSKLDSKQATSSGNDSSAAKNAATTVVAPTLEVSSALDETDPALGNGTAEEAIGGTPQAQPGTERLPVLDLNAPGKFGDKLVTDIDPEVLKEKPWRQPGANLSDYFNYGFNEQTWTEYLHKQEKLRAEYNPHKLLMGLLALQQQGKLNDSGSNTMGQESGPPNVAPPGFPMGMPPMFGGFPFPFPGMMNNMNPQQKK